RSTPTSKSTAIAPRSPTASASAWSSSARAMSGASPTPTDPPLPEGQRVGERGGSESESENTRGSGSDRESASDREAAGSRADPRASAGRTSLASGSQRAGTAGDRLA